MPSLHSRGRFGWQKIALKEADRHRLLEHIHEHPGSPFKACVQAAKAHHEATRWHLDILLAQRDILEVESGGALLYFPADQQDIAEVVAFLRASRAARAVMQHVLVSPGIMRSQLVAAASGRTVSHNQALHAFERLRKLGVLEVKGKPRSLSVWPTALGRDALAI